MDFKPIIIIIVWTCFFLQAGYFIPAKDFIGGVFPDLTQLIRHYTEKPITFLDIASQQQKQMKLSQVGSTGDLFSFYMKELGMIVRLMFVIILRSGDARICPLRG